MQRVKWLLLLLLLARVEAVQAQSIAPAADGTGTIVAPTGQRFDITGGTQSGSNLFHSFQRFGLNPGQTANFLSNPSIANILGRVTGGNASVINGLIQVTGGNSNLFLMNPAGIVFGQGASLNVPGAFTATTANGIALGNHWFNATGVNDFANLGSAPNGFAFLSNPGAIVNAGNLSVTSGQSLTLLGGTVINTGTIAAPGGNITIAAVPGQNLVRISQAGSLLSVELPTEARSGLNSPTVTPLSLPELLTLGNAASATGVAVENGVVKLTRTGSTIPTVPGTTIVDGLLSADAIDSGNGGTVHVLGEQTQFFGQITARGGSLGGNGGFVDTSGNQSLWIAPDAHVITSASFGQTGTWLIDPADLTVVATGGTATIVGGTNTPAAATTIDAGTIVTGLNGTNINLQATNSITVNAAIDSSANAAAGNLTLTAPTANLNQPITLRAGSTLNGTATTVNLGATGGVQNGVDVAAAGGTVNLAAATYTLPGQVVIDRNLTVQGQGAPSTLLSGNNASRIFWIRSAAATVTLNNLTVANGNVGDANGGGILNDGTLTINNSTVRNNVALRSGAGIRNNQTLTVNNSTISGNSAGGPTSEGGGILSFGGSSLTVNNSTISGNSAVYGGGIENYGVATVSNTTITGNSADFGGGLDNRFNFSTTVVENSIVGGNQATVAGTEVNPNGTFSSSGYNLVGQNGNAGGFPTVATDIVLAGAISTAINPTLANNGGPTQTHAVVAGSPAIDAGDPTSTLQIDQRGGQRGSAGINSGTRIDIGAYEATSSYVVTRTADDTSIGSLRAAIGFANINTNPVTANPLDTVRFNIPTTDPGYTAATNSWSIAPTSALPNITEAAIVDATTQPGYTTRPVIELNGTNAGPGIYGLTVIAGNSTIRGLTINRFFGGISLTTNGNNTVTGNYLGTDVTGTVALGNSDGGVRIDTANNTIGGTSAGSGNLISGNGSGIYVVGALTATGNQILGNKIGTDITGNSAIANQVGIQLVTPGNTIGGTTPGAGNLISGNSVMGVFLNGVNSGSTTIQGNFIGTNAAGTGAVGNGGEGIRVQNAADNTIGGGTPGAGNLISGNAGNGILVVGASSTGTTIQGNRIGLDVTGTADLGNGLEGVRVTNGASNTLIGTNADGVNDTGERNIVSGNYRANNAILPDNANIRVDTNANNTRIAGNYIGTNASGTAIPTGQPNGGVRGVQVYGASNTTIGGSTAVERNIISGNLHFGAEIVGTNPGNRIIGNYIGTDVAGNSAIANTNGGVQIYYAANTTIGGTAPGEGNLISGNTNQGIVIAGDTNTRDNSILGNLIGTNAAGTAALSNGGDGIQILNAPNNTIGGTTAAARNVISGSGRFGVSLFYNAATGNTLQGNYIGTNASGTAAIANATGIYIGAANTTIGGSVPGAGNLISGNTNQGISIDGNGNSTTIQGNLIGTNFSGTADLGNGGTGISLNGASNTLIGTNADGVNDAAERNVISGNDRQGNSITGSNANVQIYNATNTRVAGNYIGTNATGTALPTGQPTGGVRGVQIVNSNNTTIGGSTAAERNIISGNQHIGVEVAGIGTTGNRIIGNYFGTDVTGNSAIANGTGVSTFFADNYTIGGVNPGEGNLISGNTNAGLSFVGNSSTNNRAIGNYIGTNAAGTAALGNGNGVQIFLGANNNQVGTNSDGVNDAAEGNLISGNRAAGVRIDAGSNSNRIAGNSIGVGVGNGQDGVYILDASNNAIASNSITNNGRGVSITGTSATGNSVLSNSIFGNGGTIGIDLGRDGITPNSTPSSANNGQAFPVLISATGNTVTGLLNSAANTTYRLEFFSSSAIDQGQTLLGTTNVTTNAAGIANFSAIVAAIPPGGQVSATATNLTTGSTSEFAAAPGITLTATGGTPQTTVVNTPFATALQGTVRDSRGNPAGGVAVNFTAPGAGASATLTATVTTNLFGQANNPATANTIAGTYTVTATATGAPTAASFSLTNAAAAASRFSVTGFPSPTIAGTSQTFNVTAFDVFNNVATGYTGTIGFTSADPQAILPGVSNLTNGTGTFTGQLRTAGTRSLTASDTSNPGITGTQAGIVVNPASASRFSVAGFPSPTTAGTAQTFSVTAFDPFNNVATGYTGTIGFSSTDPQAVLPGTSNLTNGTGTFSGELRTAGTRSLTASDTSNSALTGTQSNIQVNSAAANRFSVAGFPTPTIAGTSQTFNVTAFDVFNNVATGYTGTIGFSSTDPQAVLPGLSNLTNGTGTFTGQLRTAGTRSLTASDTANPALTGIQANIQVNAAAPASLSSLSGTPQTATVNTPFAAALQVNVRDRFGNVVPGATVSFAAPGSGASAALSSATVTTDALGNASINVGANTIAGTYSIRSTSGSATAANFSLTNVPDVPASITPISGTPQTTIVNTAFANPLQVQVKDQYGNPIGNSSVTFSVPATGASAQLSNATVTTNPNGVASVTLAANTIAGRFTSSSSVAGVATPAQFALTNAPGAPASLTALSSTNQSATVNTAYGEALRALVRDAFGNTIPNAPVTFTLPNTGASGRFATGTTITVLSDGAGIVALPLSANTIAGTYSATGTVNGISLNFSLTNTPGAPAFITALSGNGQTALVTRAFRRSLQVQVTDAFGNVLSGIPITFNPPSTGASGQFNGVAIVTTNPNGIATAPQFSANAIAGSYTIAVSTTGLTVTPFRLNNSPVPDETRIITDLQGEILQNPEPTLLNTAPLLCAERRLPRPPIDEYRNLPECPQREILPGETW